MRLIKAVPCELFHEVKDFGRGLFAHITLCGALNEDRALPLHFLHVFLTHGAAQKVSAAQ